MLVEALSVRFRSDRRWQDGRWWVSRYLSTSTALYAARLYPSCWGTRMAVCGGLWMDCILQLQSSPLHFIANFLDRDNICILAIIISAPAAVNNISMIKQKLIYNLNKSSQPGQRLPLLKLDI